MVPSGGASRLDAAERCRRAALAFTNGAEVWTKAELAAWLVGPYREATRAGTVPPPSKSSPPPAGRKVEPAAVDELLADAHVRVLTVLENVAISRTKTSFARRLLEEHAVQRITEGGQTVGWVPIDAPRMRLAYRVLALFAADALTRPGDYESLTVCHRCERVRFRCLEETCGCTRNDG
jgi:hypothetical protein